MAPGSSPASSFSTTASGRAENLLVNGVRVSFAWENGLVTEVSADGPVRVAAHALSGTVRLGETVTREPS